MKNTIILIIILLPRLCSSQELDIFQNDSVYLKNSISRRIMYMLNDNKLQKELVTSYNRQGQMTSRTWFWNGDLKFHNTETFHYTKSGVLATIIDSFSDKHVERTKFIYQDRVLTASFEIGPNGDTTDYRLYPKKGQTTKRWYRSGKPYRYDTTIFEKENVKIEYYGIDYSYNEPQYSRWDYIYNNSFDTLGNLIRTDFKSSPISNSSANYTYDDRGLLIKKEKAVNGQIGKFSETYYFVYE